MNKKPALYGGWGCWLAEFSRYHFASKVPNYSARRRPALLACERLEDRSLLSNFVTSPTIINTVGSSSPRGFTTVGTVAFFTAHDGEHGIELWKTDGTSAGTTLVRDIKPGTGDAFANFGSPNLANVNGTLFFVANDGTHGFELWRSDGTAAGTTLVKDIRPGSLDGGSPAGSRHLTNVSGTLFFAADDGTIGRELWKSDGTAEGTTLVKDIHPGGGIGLSENWPDMVPINGTLFFQANDGSSGYELWKSDGTAAGTTLVKDIRPGSPTSFASVGVHAAPLRYVNDTLFFQANDGSHGFELWKSDGTAAGTTLVKDILVGSASPFFRSIGSLQSVNNILFFNAYDPLSGTELWRSDGTAAGTTLVHDIVPGSSGSYPAGLINVNGTLFFKADVSVEETLWRSDGTPAGTTLIKSFGLNSNLPFPAAPSMNVGGVLFFMLDDSSHGFELWKSDGTGSGTSLVLDIDPTGDSLPSQMAVWEGQLLFAANDASHGVELWKSDGIAAGTTLVRDIRTSPGDASPSRFINVNGTLFFVADDGLHGRVVCPPKTGPAVM